VELVRSLGADRVIDYKTTDFTQGDERYDLIVDMVGNHGVLALKDVLQPEGRLVIVGGPSGKWLGPLKGPIYAYLASPFVKQHMGLMLANLTPEDLQLLADLAREGKVTSVIDRRYPLGQTAQAIAYLEEGRARGKVIIAVQ
jgi:NADPH:quinone reductase-like Zn-dependent oxidoreductase